VADPIMQTPLNGQLHSGDGLSVKELPPVTKINLRGKAAAISTAVNSVTGLSSQLEPNTFKSSAANSIFWLGPDEWLLYSDNSDAASVVHKLRDALTDEHSAVVDVSDYYTVIEISGTNAISTLSSGTPLDLHPREFSAGQCAQTRFGNASILLSCKSADCYEVQVRWSFAEYVWKYLCKTGGYV